MFVAGKPGPESQPDSFVTVPRLLVVSGFEPGVQHVGAILLRQILDELSPESVHAVSVLPKRTLVASHQERRVRLGRRYESSYRPVGGWLGETAEYCAHRVLFGRHAAKIAEQCLVEANSHRCEAVLMVLDCPTLITVASLLARRLSVPLYCFVMDSPAHLCHQQGYSASTTANVIRHFEIAMNAASRIAVAGESMQEIFQSRYHKPCHVLRQGISYSPRSTTGEKRAESPIRIGFAGSVTAPDAYQSLLRGLRRRHWVLAGRPVTLRFAGAELKMEPDGPMSIEYLGWRSVEDMIRLMSECDVLYLPQPFSESLRECAELSFPNKLCTYLPARRPILLHAPAYGSLHAYFQRFPCGPVSSQLESDELISLTETLMESPSDYSRHLNAIEHAFSEDLNLNSLRQNIRMFLGCSATS